MIFLMKFHHFLLIILLNWKYLYFLAFFLYFYLVWPVNFPESGAYDISVNAATPYGGGGEFEVVLAGERGIARTANNNEYSDIAVGKFEVKEPGTYRVIISGITIDQKSGQLMNLRSVTLKSN